MKVLSREVDPIGRSFHLTYRSTPLGLTAGPEHFVPFGGREPLCSSPGARKVDELQGLITTFAAPSTDSTAGHPRANRPPGRQSETGEGDNGDN